MCAPEPQNATSLRSRVCKQSQLKISRGSQSGLSVGPKSGVLGRRKDKDREDVTGRQGGWSHVDTSHSRAGPGRKQEVRKESSQSLQRERGLQPTLDATLPASRTKAAQLVFQATSPWSLFRGGHGRQGAGTRHLYPHDTLCSPSPSNTRLPSPSPWPRARGLSSHRSCSHGLPSFMASDEAGSAMPLHCARPPLHYHYVSLPAPSRKGSEGLGLPPRCCVRNWVSDAFICGLRV